MIFCFKRCLRLSAFSTLVFSLGACGPYLRIKVPSAGAPNDEGASYLSGPNQKQYDLPGYADQLNRGSAKLIQFNDLLASPGSFQLHQIDESARIQVEGLSDSISINYVHRLENAGTLQVKDAVSARHSDSSSARFHYNDSLPVTLPLSLEASPIGIQGGSLVYYTGTVQFNSSEKGPVASWQSSTDKGSQPTFLEVFTSGTLVRGKATASVVYARQEGKKLWIGHIRPLKISEKGNIDSFDLNLLIIEENANIHGITLTYDRRNPLHENLR